jgi:hypothetical protein
MISFQFSSIPQGFWGQNTKYKGGNVKGVSIYIVFGDLQGITNKDKSSNIGGLNFEFLFSFVDSC